MSLTPAFLDELRGRLSLSQVVGRKVTWDARKSNVGKGDFWAPCPFHQEKTASFHVDDRKGFYYCFGCHAKGDLFSFVRETENVTFMEAVELLAREAGLQMPARDPRTAEKADRITRLADVMEQAIRYFRLQLRTSGASAAREYLARRGLDEAVQERWEIGFAPDHRQGVYTHLTGKGIAADLVIAAGLAAPGEHGEQPYDRFRDRIIFPIRDARGRAIALGGRAMSSDARAKYLNSPETELFDKGRTLYNLHRAREALREGTPLVVAEGYVDVIALSEAGFRASVAPLGTAITEHQLELLWRLHPEPVIALDGDQAGLRAGMRLLDLALPHLGPRRSLRFALLPGGQDPDDLIRAEGAAAMRAVLERAEPLVDMLWRREAEGRPLDTPEQRADLERRLSEVTRRIPDPGLRSHYDRELRNRLWKLLRSPGVRRPEARGKLRVSRDDPQAVLPSTRGSLLAAATSDEIADRLHEGVILATLLNHPSLLHEFLADLERVDMTGADHRAIAAAILDFEREEPEKRYERVSGKIGLEPLETLLRLDHVRLAPGARVGDGIEAARNCIAEALAKLQANRAARSEIAEAEEDILGPVDEGLTWKLGEAAKRRNNAVRTGSEKTVEYERASNGVLLDREEVERARRLFDQVAPPEGRSR